MVWSSILDRLEAQLGAPGIHLEAGLHGPAEHLSPKRLLDLAGLAADAFRAAGVEPGDRIVALLPRAGRPLLQAIFGAWSAGAVICVIAPVTEGERSSLAHERLVAMLSLVRPRTVIAADGDFDALREGAQSLGARLLMPSDLPCEGTCAHSRAQPARAYGFHSVHVRQYRSAEGHCDRARPADKSSAGSLRQCSIHSF